nr:MAG TPA: helix-turn-helix domain protein [Caudoviricetes sp.]DAT68248.1 MAG TPA: helix-turn-helix domain protein [Caudoviricetes sp.]
MPENETVGQRIKMVRQEKGMTQAQLANHEDVDVTKNYIYLIESGKTAPAEKLVKDIAKAFGVSATWLLTGEGKKYPLPEDETAAYVDQLLHDAENPLYDIIRAIMKTYSELDGNSQAVIRNTIEQIRENLKKEGRG